MNIYISDKTSTKNALAKINKFGGRSLIVIKKKKNLCRCINKWRFKKGYN